MVNFPRKASMVFPFLKLCVVHQAHLRHESLHRTRTLCVLHALPLFFVPFDANRVVPTVVSLWASVGYV